LYYKTVNKRYPKKLKEETKMKTMKKLSQFLRDYYTECGRK